MVKIGRTFKKIMNKFACGLKIEGKYANISMLIICIIVLF